MLGLLVAAASDAARQTRAHRPSAFDQDFSGYVASALVLATFAMQSMRPLRITAIASNLAFISYAAAANLHPIIILHSVLLPLNIYRLTQIERSQGRLKLR